VPILQYFRDSFILQLPGISQGHWELRVGVGLVEVSPRFVCNYDVSSSIIGDICEFVEINK